MDKRTEKLRGYRQPLSRKCTKEGHTCSRADGDLCGVYMFPDAKWRLGDCPMADAELKTDQPKAKAGKVRVGQQKQRQRR